MRNSAPCVYFSRDTLSTPKWRTTWRTTLLAALENDLPKVADRLIDRISTVGRTNFLDKAVRSIIKVPYRYEAERKTGPVRAATAGELAPVVGKVRVSPEGEEKSGAIALYLKSRLSVQISRDPDAEGGNLAYLDRLPLPPFRGGIAEGMARISPMEVTRAADALAPRKAPGPDDIPAVSYGKMPVTRRRLTITFNAVLRPGSLPAD